MMLNATDWYRWRVECVVVMFCGASAQQARCGIYKNHPYFEGAEKSTMPALAEWVIDSDKVISF